MMSSTSKSCRRKPKEFKLFSKLKQQWNVNQHTRNWLELPYDVTANILHRVGVFDILENAQKVCTTWRKICKDPAMWRVIYMKNQLYTCARPLLREMCKHAVDRSQGQLVDITVVDFANRDLLEYIADRSSQIRRLGIACCDGEFYKGWTTLLKKFPSLEELSLYQTNISKEDIEGAAHCCLMLTTLKVSQEAFEFRAEGTDEESLRIQNEIPIAIGKNLPELRHLELFGSIMSNTGLQAILDGCRHLESLDLRRCMYIDLAGDLGKTCSEKVKCLKLPNDPLEECPYIRGDYCVTCVISTAPKHIGYCYSDFEYGSYSYFDHYILQ